MQYITVVGVSSSKLSRPVGLEAFTADFKRYTVASRPYCQMSRDGLQAVQCKRGSVDAYNKYDNVRVMLISPYNSGQGPNIF